MLVVDASALLDVLTRPHANRSTVRRLGVEDLHAPHLLDPELLAGLRSLDRRGVLSTRRAAEVLEDLASLEIRRYGHAHLVERAWQLRANATSYDAMYVALAELLECPLLTADRRLAGAPGVRCPVELMAGG